MPSTKAKSLLDLEIQIAALQKRAAQVRNKQYKKALDEIIALMKAFGITIDEVKKAASNIATRVRASKGLRRRGRPRKAASKKAAGKTAQKSAKKPGKGKRSRKPAPVKYKGPGGETWSGRGKQPVWLRALVEGGRKLDDFKI